MVEVETATGCGALADLNRAVENPLLAMLREQSATRQSFEMLNGGLSPFMVAIAGTASGALAELRRAGGSPGSDMLDEQRSAVREALEVLAGNGSSAIAALAGNRELFEGSTLSAPVDLSALSAAGVGRLAYTHADDWANRPIHPAMDCVDAVPGKLDELCDEVRLSRERDDQRDSECQAVEHRRHRDNAALAIALALIAVAVSVLTTAWQVWLQVRAEP